MNKIVIAIVSVLIAGAIVGGYFYPQNITRMIVGAPTGSTYNSATAAAIVVNLANTTTNGTSSSIQNTSTSDWYINSLDVGCENIGTSQTAYTGAGLASLTLSVATSATAAPAVNANTNKVGNSTITIGTSTTVFAISSSTTATNGSASVNIIWPSGSYLNFFTNATNSAVCTFRAAYFSS